MGDEQTRRQTYLLIYLLWCTPVKLKGRKIQKHKSQHQVIYGITTPQQKLHHTGPTRKMLSIHDFHVLAPVLLQVTLGQ